MGKTRNTYMTTNTAERFEGLIIKTDDYLFESVIVKTKRYDVLSLLKLLHAIESGPVNFTKLYQISQIRMKKSFLNYLRMAVNYKFVKKRSNGSNMNYSITNKGIDILNMFEVKDELCNKKKNIVCNR